MKRLFSFAFLLCFASVGHADLMISGGTAGFIPSDSETDTSNQLIQPTLEAITGTNADFTPLAGFFGAQIEVGSRVKSLVFTYYGAEAGYLNEFYVNKSGGWTREFKHTGGTVTGDQGSVEYAIADLKNTDPGGDNNWFKFAVPNNGQEASNGSNPDNGSNNVVNFFAHQLGWGDVLLFLDDAGAGDDDNHDDMVVRIQAVVPEPGTMSLAVLGMACLAGRQLRRRR